MKTIILTVLISGCVGICAALAQKVEPSDPTAATKAKVERSCGSLGMPMAVVSDDGETLIGPGPINGDLKNLTSLGTNELLAVYNRSLMASEDGGCTWTAVDHSFGGNITAGRNGEAYIWNAGGRCLDTGDPTRVILQYQSRRAKKIYQMANPFLCLSTFVVDASDPSHLRAAGKYPVSSHGALLLPPPPDPIPELPTGWKKFENFDKRAIADSTDGGKTWKVIARYPINDIPSDIFISPKNPDHILLSSSFKEGSVSFDGGKTWWESKTEFSSVVISPVDDKIVWTTGIDSYEREANPNATEILKANNGKAGQTTSLKSRYWRLFQSHDGGITFSNVLSRPINNFTEPFLPSSLTGYPGDAEQVYFATTNRFYKYNAKTGVLSLTGALSKDRKYLSFIRGILPMPEDTSQIFLALSISENRQTASNGNLKIDSKSNLSRPANASVGLSTNNNLAVPPIIDEVSKLPAQMPSAVEFHYMRNNGQTPLTTIDIKNGLIDYEYREDMTSRPVRRSRKISSEEAEALYRVFIDNKFDLIRNDPPVEQANDTSNERISITLGPGNYTQIVFDPIVAPLSGDSLKRFDTIKKAMFKLLDLEAPK